MARAAPLALPPKGVAVLGLLAAGLGLAKAQDHLLVGQRRQQLHDYMQAVLISLGAPREYQSQSRPSDTSSPRGAMLLGPG